MCRWGESFSETASQGKGESRRRRFCDDVSEERERERERRGKAVVSKASCIQNELPCNNFYQDLNRTMIGN